MRKVFLFAGLALALVALAVFLPGSARSAAHGTSLPFKGSFTGQTTLNLQTGQLHFTEAGPTTHLGWATVVLDGYAIPDGSGGFNVLASFVVTAADGSQLFGPCTGTVTTTVGGDHLSTADCVATGGTGRFEGGSGHFTVTSLTTNVVVVGTTMSGDLESTVDGVLNLNLP